MNTHQRPWWLFVHKSSVLVTHIEDRSRPGERVFVIRGEPVVKGLAWLTCGPLSALAVIALLTGVAVAVNMRELPGLTRMLFVAALLGLPALVWGLTVFVTSRMSAQHIQAIKDASSKTCVIKLRPKTGEMAVKTVYSDHEDTLSFAEVQRARVAPAIGAKDGKAVVLSLETDDGPLVLLDESLGNHNQKADLAQAIQSALKKYAQKQNPPTTE